MAAVRVRNPCPKDAAYLGCGRSGRYSDWIGRRSGSDLSVEGQRGSREPEAGPNVSTGKLRAHLASQAHPFRRSSNPRHGCLCEAPKGGELALCRRQRNRNSSSSIRGSTSHAGVTAAGLSVDLLAFQIASPGSSGRQRRGRFLDGCALSAAVHRSQQTCPRRAPFHSAPCRVQPALMPRSFPRSVQRRSTERITS